MNKLNIALKEVEIINVDKISKAMTLSIRYKVENREKLINHNTKLKDAELMSEEIFKRIRETEDRNSIDLSDDILSNITLISFDNQEDVEAKLIGFLSRFKEQLKNFEKTKTATNYLDKYHSLKNQKVNF
ncbi:MAG: hypothetical protein PHG05_01100 [Candidatus Nanoarchaeia archaeon]|nr:hypothetical protein [Candidatus Nanoarchaeia archaeon]